MSLLMMDVHGLVEYSNIKNEPIIPPLLQWVTRQKQTEDIRVIFWTASSQSEGEKYLKKYGVLHGDRRFSLRWEDWIDELDNMHPYKCIGNDSITFLQQRIARKDIKGVSRVMRTLGMTGDVDDFMGEFRRWFDQDIYERPKKNPRIFANRDDTSVVLVESDGTRFDMYGNPQPNKAVTGNLIDNASRYGYDLILVPESRVWRSIEMPFSQTDVGLSLRGAIDTFATPDKRVDLKLDQGYVYDIGGLRGLYNAAWQAQLRFESGSEPNAIDINVG